MIRSTKPKRRDWSCSGVDLNLEDYLGFSFAKQKNKSGAFHSECKHNLPSPRERARESHGGISLTGSAEPTSTSWVLSHLSHQEDELGLN